MPAEENDGYGLMMRFRLRKYLLILMVCRIHFAPMEVGTYSI
jgi:hypothetical protein